jgi:predicted phage terminase large subunit-like protein
MGNYTYADKKFTPKQLEETLLEYPEKIGWFLSKGYAPHYYQIIFHTDQNKKHLTRFRHLVAGRRGGKTLSAAWEVLFYCLHPTQFHLDAHGRKSDQPLWVWALSASYKVGRPSYLTFREACIQAGLTIGKEVKENKGGLRFEFENGSLVEFKSAEDPQSLRGAGLDILWMDEAAFIKNEEAWGVTRPSLSDKQGLLITTTTPNQKNWFYEEFFSPESRKDATNSRVEYRSIDNPYFRKEEWEYVRSRYHPLLFAQEYMASFDSMAGKDLAGDWLHYYEPADLLDEEGKTRKLRKYMGVDPAISLSANADKFVITVIGVADSNEVFLLEQYAARIPFAEQLLKIEEYYIKHKPELIGIESNAYQAALVQQTERLNSMPPVVPMFAKGKKWERILAMSPLFRIGKVRIRKDQVTFIQEWVDYDSALQKPHDDCLDSMEIALRTAGALLGEFFDDRPKAHPSGLPDWILADRPGNKKEDMYVDEFMGSMW